MKDDVLVAYAKNTLAANTAYFGYTLNEWVSILSICFIIVNTIAVLPATVKVIRGWLSKFKEK